MAEPALDVESHRKQVADAQAAHDKSAEAVALMMLSQAFYEADRLADARQAYLQACQMAKDDAYSHQTRLAQSEALMARGLELAQFRPAAEMTYRAFFSAAVILEDLGDDGRAVRETAYEYARWVEEERIRPGQRSFDRHPAGDAAPSMPRKPKPPAAGPAGGLCKQARPKNPANSSTPTVSRSTGTDKIDPAIRDALARRERRAEARRILDTDPALARELCIGRPDLPRRYDDGGVLDVNHVPVDFLAGLPGFTAELARQVVEVRAEFGGFTLLSELVVYAGVPDGLAEELADRLVFLS